MENANTQQGKANRDQSISSKPLYIAFSVHGFKFLFRTWCCTVEYRLCHSFLTNTLVTGNLNISLIILEPLIFFQNKIIVYCPSPFLLFDNESITKTVKPLWISSQTLLYLSFVAFHWQVCPIFFFRSFLLINILTYSICHWEWCYIMAQYGISPAKNIFCIFLPFCIGIICLFHSKHSSLTKYFIRHKPDDNGKFTCLGVTLILSSLALCPEIGPVTLSF